MSKKRPGKIFYWETTVFIDWYEKSNEKRVGMIRSALDDVNAKRAILVTSVVTLGEILCGNLKNGTPEELERVFKLPNIQVVDLTIPISNFAGKLRRAHPQHLKKLADAQHLATAIVCRASEVHTFDDEHLIPLNGNVAGEPLAINYPRGDNPVLI